MGRSSEKRWIRISSGILMSISIDSQPQTLCLFFVYLCPEIANLAVLFSTRNVVIGTVFLWFLYLVGFLMFSCLDFHHLRRHHHHLHHYYHHSIISMLIILLLIIIAIIWTIIIWILWITLALRMRLASDLKQRVYKFSNVSDCLDTILLPLRTKLIPRLRRAAFDYNEGNQAS